MIHRGEELILIQEAPLTLAGSIHGLCAQSPPRTDSGPVGLAYAQMERYAETYDRRYLEAACRDFRTLSNSASPNDPCIAEYQTGLCAALRQFYELTGQEDALVEALTVGEASVWATLPNATFEERSVNFANALFMQYAHSSETDNLERALNVLLRAVEVSTGTASSSLVAVCLAECHRLRSLAFNNDDSASLTRALDILTPMGSHATDMTIVIYVHCLQQRYMRVHDDSDLNIALEIAEQALAVQGVGILVRAQLMQSLSISFALRSPFSGGLPDLNRGIEIGRQGLELIRDHYSIGPRAQASLALMVLHRYLALGLVVELDQVVTDLEASVETLPHTSLERSSSLHVLTMTYLYRFDMSGRTADLDAMISYARQCVAATSIKRVRYSTNLVLLSDTLWTRYQHLHHAEDLNEYVQLATRAAELRPINWSCLEAACIGNLGAAERRLFLENGNPAHLNNAITHLHRAIGLHDGKWGRLELQGEYFELGEVYLSRAELTNSEADWASGIQAHRRGLQYVPPGHARRTRALLAPAIGSRKHFLATGDGNLDECMQLLREAISMTPVGLPNRARVLLEYGRTSILLYQRHQQAADLNNAWNAYRTAAQDAAGFVQDRYECAVHWIQLAKEQRDLRGAVDASAVAIHLLPRLAWIGMPQDARIKSLKRQTVCLGVDAAAMAIEIGSLEEAVELLEAGRTVFWTQILELRADSQELQRIAPALARELEEVGRGIELSGAEDSSSTQSALERRRRSAERWDLVVREVRKLEGYERFLLPARFALLRQAATDAPIVILTVSTARCDVLIITTNHPVQHVPLPLLTAALARDMGLAIVRASGQRSDRAGRALLENIWLQVLERLWQVFGQPLCTTLARMYPTGPPRRIRLCPVGIASLLPLHAAMPRGTNQRGIPDLFCCSYTAAITPLLRSLRNDHSSGMQQLLAVIVPSVPGQRFLSGAHEEKQIVQQLRLGAPPTILEGPAATIHNVTTAMQHHEWLHIATHGKSIGSQPLDSCLYLYDGPLTLARISELRLPRVKFAFLSACHTARGSEQIPDECLHFAAGLQFAGVEGIIATMGEVADKDAPEVARVVYSHIMRDGQVPDHRDAAEGLQRAITNLRRQNVPASRWAPFIHVG